MKIKLIKTLSVVSVFLLVLTPTFGAVSKRLSDSISWHHDYKAEYVSYTIDQLDYYFSDAGSYDQMNVRAHTLNGYRGSVQAKSKDGQGQWKSGNFTKNGEYSYANQGAQRGTDYAYLYR